MSFNKVFSEQPQTVAYGITDSPLGCSPGTRSSSARTSTRTSALERDAVLAHEDGRVRRAALLRERPRDRQADRADDGPIGLAGFGGDFSGIRRFAERDHSNIVSWNMYPSGGHFAAHKAPDELVGDMRAFYRPLR
jgi:hypothetical protein